LLIKKWLTRSRSDVLALWYCTYSRP